MTIEQIFLAQLDAIEPQPFAFIGGAASFAAIEATALPASPAAYVLVEEEVSAPNEHFTGPVLQRCEADIAVVIMVRNVADASGEAAAGDIGELKAVVRRALIGLAIGEAGEPVEHVEGKLLKARNGQAWHRELFSAAFYLAEGE